MARAKQPPQIHQMSVAQFERMFPDEDSCCTYLVGKRWPEGVRCPRCGSERIYDLKTRKWHWECPDCRQGGAYRFSHLTGTIFENTNKPLRDWYRVIHLMLTSKKGISARQVWRYMGFGSLKTAWYMCHRVRIALIEDIGKLGGIVEVDETFVGGLAKNRHWELAASVPEKLLSSGRSAAKALSHSSLDRQTPDQAYFTPLPHVAAA